MIVVRVRQAEDVGEVLEVFVVVGESLAAHAALVQPRAWICVPIAPSSTRIRSASSESSSSVLSCRAAEFIRG